MIKDAGEAELTIKEQSLRLQWLLLIIATILMLYAVFLTNIIMEKYIDLINVKIILPNTTKTETKISGNILTLT